MARKKPELRRSQMVFTYGPGAIVDLRTPKGNSVSSIMRSLDDWNATALKAYYGVFAQKLVLDRLKNLINEKYGFDINDFRWPPVEGIHTQDQQQLYLDSIRFPRWLTCPKCNALKKKWNRPMGITDRFCDSCSNVAVVPTRFVINCDNGHINDFDYDYWLYVRGRDGKPEGCETRTEPSGSQIMYHPKLKLNQGKSLSLSSMTVNCTDCGRWAGMAGIFEKDVFEQLGKMCDGIKAWTDKKDECYLYPTVQQRSSRAIYFPTHESALDIPPYNDLPNKMGIHWGTILNAARYERLNPESGHLKHTVGAQLNTINNELFSREEDHFTLSGLIEAIKDHFEHEENANKNPRVDEFERLNDKKYDRREDSPDIQLLFEPVPEKYTRHIENLVRVVRMREIRALIGFSRKKSDNPMQPLWDKPQKWLPAIETNGEGIFFSFKNDFMTTLEMEYGENGQIPSVIQEWNERLEDEDPFCKRGAMSNVKVDAKFIFLHTVSHILMRQLSLDSGYSTPSLHERIFCDDHMAGILIYTASVDSEGTLGGLSRIGRKENFEQLLSNALKEADFCSADPLCSSGDMSLSEPLNGASCYNCSILPETCCDHFNLFLDRTVLKAIVN